MSTHPIKHTLTLGRTRVADFTEYLSLDGVAISFDQRDLDALAAACAQGKELSSQGRQSAVSVVGPDLEFLGLDGLHELEVEAVTIDATGRIVIHAEVRHGNGEGVDVVLSLEELQEAACS